MLFSKRISELTARVAELEGLNATASDNISALTAERDTAVASVTDLTGTIEALTTEKVGLETKVADLEGKLAERTPEAVAKEVEKGVTATIAAMPIEQPLARGEGQEKEGQVPDSAKTAEEIFNTYSAMASGAERTAYFAKHKALLMAFNQSAD